jgi:hypothetical protein
VPGQPVHPGGTLATVTPGGHGLLSWSVRNVPWWGVLSSALGPALLVGGWTVATRLQPPSFDPVTDTVSALAAVGAADRWVMTLTFLVVGACDIVTAEALRPAGLPGRLILVAGAAGGMLVALNPEHFGGSVQHAFWATIGFGGMALWPAGAWRRGPSVPWGLRPAVCAGAVAVLVALSVWFGAELVTGAGQAGLAERIVGVAQALWPVTVVLSCRFSSRAIVGSTAYALTPFRLEYQKNILIERSVVPRPDHRTPAWSWPSRAELPERRRLEAGSAASRSHSACSGSRCSWRESSSLVSASSRRIVARVRSA